MILLALIAFYSDIPPSGHKIPTEIHQGLSGTLTYLGEGSQTVAYLSSDGACVLKLFKATHEKSFKFTRLFQRRDKAQSSGKWRQKFEDTARRTALAYDHLRGESALLYLHFQATGEPLTVTLKEHSGIVRHVDLSSLPFVIQKKAILAPEYLSSLIAQGERQKALEAVASLKALFEARALKGFSDPRQTLSTNYGFIDGKAIQIDVGKLERDPDADPSKVHAKVDGWISKNFPLLL